MESKQGILIFDLVGKFAHFRKFYTNSSSLSYLFPPRTTIEGIIAGILGIDRDCYYDILSPEKCRITISPKTPVRSLFQTLNYLYVKSASALNGKDGRTQIPLEIIVPKFFNENLRYRIYVSGEADLLSNLGHKLTKDQAFYPTSLGSAQFLCKAIFIANTPPEQVIQQPVNETISINTPLIATDEVIKSILVAGNTGLKILTDIFPFHFQRGRIPMQNQKLIFDRDFRPLMVSNLNITVTKVNYTKDSEVCEENIFFADNIEKPVSL